MKRWNVQFYIAFVFIFLVYLDTVRYSGERPVLFTILFTPATFMLLENFKNSKGKLIFLLLPLMLLWANLHGGFIIGVTIILVYMVLEGLKIAFRKSTFTGPEIAIFYSAAALALAMSYINPTGWDAFSIALSSKYKFMEQGIQEYQSPWISYIKKLAPINYGYVLLSLFFPIILLLRNKKMDITHVGLLTGFFLMAARTGRYSIFYVGIAAMVLGKETSLLFTDLFKNLSEKISERLLHIFGILIFVSSLLFFIGVVQFKWLKMDIARGSYVPETSVNFIEQNRLPGNILNSHPYGGYITWRLYPWKQTFIDTRWLNYTLQKEYSWIMSSAESFSGKKSESKRVFWRRLIDNYNINIILLDTIDVYGTVPKLLLTLTEDEEWAPIHCEPIAVIFVKNIPENSTIIEKYRLPKQEVYDTIIGLASQMAIYNAENPKFLITLGKTFEEMGRLSDALTAYKYAYRRFPKEPGLREKINQMESELQKENHERH
jgi:hypothetical protein